MKTSELTGAALDWAVAECEGYFDKDMAWIEDGKVEVTYYTDYSPSTKWQHAGEIIEREMIELVPVSGALWEAYKRDQHIPNDGATPLIAAMRCYVASKLGDEIDVPEELTDE
jgi:hypothetical protein